MGATATVCVALYYRSLLGPSEYAWRRKLTQSCIFVIENMALSVSDRATYCENNPKLVRGNENGIWKATTSHRLIMIIESKRSCFFWYCTLWMAVEDTFIGRVALAPRAWPQFKNLPRFRCVKLRVHGVLCNSRHWFLTWPNTDQGAWSPGIKVACLQGRTTAASWRIPWRFHRYTADEDAWMQKTRRWWLR